MLNGSFGAFQPFYVGIGDGNTTYYTIENGSRWEVGQGVFDLGSNSLSRDIVFDSSSGGSKVELEGVSIVFCTLPASKAFLKDPNESVSVNNILASGDANLNSIFSNSINNSGDLNVGENTLVSGDLQVLGDFNYNGDITLNSINVSGEIVSEGFLTLVRDGDGNFFHAYKDDGTRQTIALHVDSNVSPLWKLGLKTNPNNQTDEPTFAYVYARDGLAGLVSNDQNFQYISDTLGFTVVNDSHLIFRAGSNTGVYIDAKSTVQPAFTIQGAPLSIADLQVWENALGSTLSVVDSGGKVGILTDTPDYDLDVNGSGRMESIYLTSGIYFQDGTFQSSASTGGGTGDAVEVSGWADQTFDLQGVTDRGNNTTNSIFTGGDFFASGDITATSGQLSGINFTPLVEADRPGYLEGRVFYDAENHCVTVYNDESDISLQVGQEEYIRVRNTTGSTITNGSPVYITGAQGQHTTVDLTTATEELKSEAVGIATHDIENNSFGYITTFGLVRGINTTAFTEGDELFVSVTDGELTSTSPIAPNYKTSVGHVVVAGVNGSILVTPRDHKLGGGDVKTLGNIAQSGIAFFESVTNDGDAGILASDPNFYFDIVNNRVQVDTGGIRFDDGTIQTTASAGAGNRTYNNITADFSMSDTSDVVFMDTTSGPINVYIPTATGQGGKEIMIKMKAGSNSGVLIANGVQTIDGQSQVAVYNRYESITLVSDNSNWFIS